VPFDVAVYREAMLATHSLTARCDILGRSLFALRKVGERLSIDRIDPGRGYVAGNMRLIAMSLNTAKGTNKEVPQWAINKLLRKLERTVNDKLSRPGATHRI
jgi:hypothetical protein